MEIRWIYQLAIRILQKNLISFESSLELLNKLDGTFFCTMKANIMPLEVIYSDKAFIRGVCPICLSGPSQSVEILKECPRCYL